MDISITLIISYVVFSFFLFYQQLHLKNFRGSSELFQLGLGLFALLAMIYGLCFLIYWGINVSWIQAVILFAISIGVNIIWFPIEAKLGLRNSYWIFSLIGFITIPISGFFMWASLP